MTQSSKIARVPDLLDAGIAQLVERNLAKVEVASSNLVFRSIKLFVIVICFITTNTQKQITFLIFARVVELVDTQDLKSCIL